MDTNLKDKIKMATAIGVLLIIIIVVFIIVVQYQVEGEKNMPFKLSKITIISTAEGEQNTDNFEETAKWNLTINQNNDVYFFINKNETSSEQSAIESVTIENINVTKTPTKGIVKSFMPSSTDGRTFTYDNSYIITDKLQYKGAKTSSSKTLEICNQGGSAMIRFSNTGVGNFISNDDYEIKHDGSLLEKVGTTEEEVKFNVNFDIIIRIDKINYKANITLNFPCENLITEGTTTKEITDVNNVVFKRVK